ncbi:MAG: hypothetical protein IT563_17815 [Alphaproteobacteria bacterium]|nr:hypothetical protein [Alphaproteobacteria bacterium]
MPTDGSWRGAVVHLHLAAGAGLPMQPRQALALLAGQGVAGGRYKDGTGFYSNKPEEGRPITLFEVETLEALAPDHGVVINRSGLNCRILAGGDIHIGDVVEPG